MAMHDADIETDRFFTIEGQPNCVYRRGLVEARETDNQLTGRAIETALVCECEPHLDGAAEEIARSLNRLPKAEALLIKVAQAIRTNVAEVNLGWEGEGGEHLNALGSVADQIEEFIVNG